MSIYDMLLSNAMGEGGGGGGGGSSDFSTAQVTLITQGDYVALFSDNDGEGLSTSVFYAPIFESGEVLGYYFSFETFAGDTNPSQCESTLIYHGNSITIIAEGSRVSETGAVTYDENTNKYIVTGDCTITLDSE